MKIKQIEFKNFASYGNRIQKIDFTDSNGDLYLVLGNNGAGKSTLAKVITYLCYGKVDGSSLKDLPNRVNSSLWGKILIESKGNEIEIERGINPGIFNVKINGSEYDVAGKSNMQEFLETEMYEIPYQVFKNVIILSVNDFKSFITMSPYDKKMIVDRIFGFSVINEMRDLVKQKRKGILDELRTFEDEIRTLGDSIKSVTKKLEQFEKDNQERSKEKVDKIRKSLEELKEKKNTFLRRLELSDVARVVVLLGLELGIHVRNLRVRILHLTSRRLRLSKRIVQSTLHRVQLLVGAVELQRDALSLLNRLCELLLVRSRLGPGLGQFLLALGVVVS